MPAQQGGAAHTDDRGPNVHAGLARRRRPQRVTQTGALLRVTDVCSWCLGEKCQGEGSNPSKHSWEGKDYKIWRFFPWWQHCPPMLHGPCGWNWPPVPLILRAQPLAPNPTHACPGALTGWPWFPRHLGLMGLLHPHCRWAGPEAFQPCLCPLESHCSWHLLSWGLSQNSDRKSSALTTCFNASEWESRSPAPWHSGSSRDVTSQSSCLPV